MLFLKKWLVLLVLIGAVVWCSYSIASDYESIEVISLARTLTPAKVSVGYSKAFITIEGGNIRFRKDGGALASTTEGVLLSEGDTIQLKNRKELTHASFVRDATNSASTTIRVHYEDN